MSKQLENKTPINRDIGDLYKKRAGVSLLVSLILIGLLVLFGLIVSGVVVSAIRESANVNQANQAFYAAEGALEQGLLENWNKGAGYSNDVPQGVVYGDDKKNLQANFKIMGQVPDGENYKYADGYGIPAPGSGDAGNECDSLNPYVKVNFYYSLKAVPHYVGEDKITEEQKNSGDYTGPYLAINHPCNWGKLKVGESVVIPLYVTKNGKVLNPADQELNLTGLKIKFRTPCPIGEYCEPIKTRMQLDTVHGDPQFICDDDNPVRCGDAIVAWEISGSSVGGGKSYILKAYDELNLDGTRLVSNSEIYEKLINEGKKNTCSDCAVFQGDKGEEIDESNDKIINFLTDKGQFTHMGDDKINKPILKLFVIHSLQEDVFKNIPYLEYQIITNTNIAPTDIAQTITAEGYSGPFKQVLEVKQPQESGVVEYVIQQ